ncbi:hypothetical protein BH24ACI1_BH24ACI1_29370 [soil metagenome]
MTQEHFIIELLCRVDDFMPNLKFDEHSILHLSLAEFTYDFASTNSYAEYKLGSNIFFNQMRFETKNIFRNFNIKLIN